jgi:hypothetical protein
MVVHCQRPITTVSPTNDRIFNTSTALAFQSAWKKGGAGNGRIMVCHRAQGLQKLCFFRMAQRRMIFCQRAALMAAT